MNRQFSADLIARQRLLAERESFQKALGSRRQAGKAGVNRTKVQQQGRDAYAGLKTPEAKQAYATQYMNDQNKAGNVNATKNITGWKAGEDGADGSFTNFNEKRAGAQMYGGTSPSGKPVAGQMQLNQNLASDAKTMGQMSQLGLDPSLNADPAAGAAPEPAAPAPDPAAAVPLPAAAPAPAAGAAPPAAGVAPAPDPAAAVPLPVPDPAAAVPLPADPAAAPAPAAGAAPAAAAPAAAAPAAGAAPAVAALDPTVTAQAQQQAAGKDMMATSGARPEKNKWSDKSLAGKVGSIGLGLATGGVSTMAGMAGRAIGNIGVKGKQNTYDQAQGRQDMRAMGVNPTMAQKSAQNIRDSISHLTIRKQIQKQEEWERQRDAGEDFVEGWDNPADYDRDQGSLKGLSPKEALKHCEGGGCVWLKDWAEENYGEEDDPHYHYPVEDPEDLLTMIEEGVFEGPNAPEISTDPFTEEETQEEPNMADAMRSAKIGNGTASFGDLMDDRDRELGKGLELLSIRQSIQKSNQD
tara:strand:- start:62853 stop:64421 length:1569 start_codon:yes stop_codon:yes gene_type:complete